MPPEPNCCFNFSVKRILISMVYNLSDIKVMCGMWLLFSYNNFVIFNLLVQSLLCYCVFIYCKFLKICVIKYMCKFRKEGADKE